MKNIFIHISLGFLLSAFSTNFAVAQNEDANGDLGTEDIVISNDYQARIADAQRLRINPFILENAVSKPSFSYNVQSRLLELQYPAHSLRPLAMPKLKPEDYQNSYVRLGFGTQIMPLAHIVYNDKPNEKVQYGAYYKHLSANGKRENQKFRDNALGAYAQYFLKQTEIGMEMKFIQDADFYYGYNETDTSFASKDVKQRLQSVGGTVYFKNAGVNTKEVNYVQDISFATANDIYENKEWYLRYGSKIEKTFKNSHFLNIEGSADISNFKPNDGAEDVEREIFQLGAAYTFNNDDWKLTAGLITAFGDVIEGEAFNIYPKLYTEKKLFKNHLIFYSGWTRVLQKNTYANFLSVNPYIHEQDTLTNSRVEDRMAGFKGSAKNFSYNLRFSNKVILNAPLFVNDQMDMKRMEVVYDKRLTVINLNVEAGYNWNEKLRSMLTLDFMLYEPDQNEKAWHLPMFSTNLATSYHLKKKILFKTEIYALAGAFGRNELGLAEKIKPTVDINLGAEYKFSKYLSFFATLNNLANIKYQRYYNYPTYGFNAMIGAQFSY